MKWGSNTWVGGGLVGLALGVAIFAPWIALTDPVMDANLMNAELPPSWEFPVSSSGSRSWWGESLHRSGSVVGSRS